MCPSESRQQTPPGHRDSEEPFLLIKLSLAEYAGVETLKVEPPLDWGRQRPLDKNVDGRNCEYVPRRGSGELWTA